MMAIQVTVGSYTAEDSGLYYKLFQTDTKEHVKYTISHPVIQAAILDGIALEATSHHVLNTANMAFCEEINLR